MESLTKSTANNATSLDAVIKNLQALKVGAPRKRSVSELLSQQHAIDNLAKRMYHHISRKDDAPQPREPTVDDFVFRRFKIPVEVLLALRHKSRQIARNPTAEHKPRCSHAIRKMEHLRGQARQMHNSALATTMMLRARAAAGYFVFARVLFGRLRADNVDVRAELDRAFDGQMPKVAQLLQLPSFSQGTEMEAAKEQDRDREGGGEKV